MKLAPEQYINGVRVADMGNGVEMLLGSRCIVSMKLSG
jgi:hypothetical protein